MTCTKCRCPYDEHDVSEFSTQSLLDELELGESPLYKMYTEAQKLAKQYNVHWLPIGLHPAEVSLKQSSELFSAFVLDATNS